MAVSDRAVAGSDDFYDGLPSFQAFATITDPGHYRPLPPDWVIGIADVVGSGRAIAAGRYKAVNTVGAAVIAAVTNALPNIAFPFSFGGDGASLAVPAACAPGLRTALARTAAWSEDALDLELRVAVVPIEAVREAGLDVRVSRYDVGQGISYAMFAGGGMAWAEQRLKEGGFRLARGARGNMPDLTGLTCGFATVGSVRGTILSVIVVPHVEDAKFTKLVDDVIGLIEASDAEGPTPHRRPEVGFADTTLAAAVALAQTPAAREGSVGNAGAPVSSGPPPPAMQDTDFRKFGDGLRMTIDCDPVVADAIERMLGEAQGAGICHYGVHRQDAANLTCLLPSTRSRNAHFIDGAQGGYAAAAAKLKATATT